VSDLVGMTEFGETGAPGMPAHVYFHVPFCRSKCSYCDFASVADATAEEVFAVFSGMEAEVRRWAFSALPGMVETIYVGGGTPSLHPAAVSSLLLHARDELPICDDAEITVEANPDSLTPLALEALLESGVNRISVGVQAFDDRVLGILGRLHNAKEAREALALARDVDVALSVDLMCGIPGQSPASWAESLEEALDAGAQHVSVYPLALEEGTALALAVSSGLLAEPDPDIAAEMMLAAETRLGAAGLMRYEVANYARPGCEARHNNAYWTGGSYIGIGPGAHGMLSADVARTIGVYGAHVRPDVARVRYASEDDPLGWLRGEPGSVEFMTAEEAVREDVMLGMRLARGVLAAQVTEACLGETLLSLARDGLVEQVDGRWRTTQRGWLLGNEVFGRIWTQE
jgi:oxygen-independent coproporphyrinogen III oxidase